MVDVAVIGAGAAGLIAAHELLQAGHGVTVFEQAETLGGLWNYTDEVEDDPLGQRPTTRIYGSLYPSLRVNLPTDLMAFEGYPFDQRLPRYPGHRQVLGYLRAFAGDRRLLDHVRFDRRVRSVRPTATDWSVDGEAFDAVAVCNGHFSEPLVPTLPGFPGFPGMALHSHNYRRPDVFAGKRVMLLGSSVSGNDLAIEIATAAETVYFSGRLFEQAPPLSSQAGRIQRCPPVAGFRGADVMLANGETVADVDAFVFCTGYHYRFPFLPPGLVTVKDNAVHALYRQLVVVDHPTCAFVGLPFRIVPFPVFQRQARWFARSLAGHFALPDQAGRRCLYMQDVRQLDALGMPRRHYHRLEDRQFEYLTGLAQECGDDPVPDGFAQLWRDHHAHVRRYPLDFRDKPLQPGSVMSDGT